MLSLVLGIIRRGLTFKEKILMTISDSGRGDAPPPDSPFENDPPTPKGKRATYQDVLDAPPNMVAEIVYGTLYTHPRPAMPHARATSRLGARLGTPFDADRGSRSGPGGWWIIDEPELHLGEEIVVPDMAGWRRENMPEYPLTAYCSLAPDWVCEVLSPSTRALDRGAKQAIYAREGVQHLWFVDPGAKTLGAFELREGRWVLLKQFAGNANVSVPPFDAITFSLADLWPNSRAHGGDHDG